MKTSAVVVLVALAGSGCHGLPRTGNNPALKSEREYAADSEARAQNLYRSGQASSISDARAQAAAEANAEWAAAAKAAERQTKQEKFEKDFRKSLGDGTK